MRVTAKTLGNGICLLFSVFFITGCSAPEKKIAAPKVYVVEIKQMKFEPEILWLRRGDTVVFINRDIVAHNVTESYNAWASPLISVGELWKMAVNQHEDYFCTIHPMMKGRLRIMNNLMQ